VDKLIVASRAVHFAAGALMFGVPAFRLAVAPGWPGAPRGRLIELAAALAALLSGLGWFLGVATEIAGGGWSDAISPDILQAVAFDTHFGRLWAARCAVLVAIAGVQALAKPSRARDIALAILAAGFAGSLVGVGHGLAGGAGGEALAPVHAAADIVHLLCAALWIGALFCLGRLLAAAGPGRMDTLRAVLPRFSLMGYWAVALLLISGCVNSVILVPSLSRLFGTDYGHVLLVKIGLALLMVAIAIVNRIVFAPKIMTGKQDATALRRSVLVEQGVGLLVLVSVAWLGTIHPVP